jgi:hypothetical protein
MVGPCMRCTAAGCAAYGLCDAAGEGPGAAGEAQEGLCPFDQLLVELQLDIVSRAQEPQAAGVSRGSA